MRESSCLGLPHGPCGVPASSPQCWCLSGEHAFSGSWVRGEGCPECPTPSQLTLSSPPTPAIPPASSRQPDRSSRSRAPHRCWLWPPALGAGQVSQDPAHLWRAGPLLTGRADRQRHCVGEGFPGRPAGPLRMPACSDGAAKPWGPVGADRPCGLREPCPAGRTARLDGSHPGRLPAPPGQRSSRPRGRSLRGLPSRTRFSAKASPRPEPRREAAEVAKLQGFSDSLLPEVAPGQTPD